MITSVTLAKSSTFTTDILHLPHSHGCIFQKCLTHKFVKEVYDFLDLPPVPPQLMSLSVRQKIQATRYEGDPNDEEAIRQWLLQSFSCHLFLLRRTIDPTCDLEEFHDLTVLKNEIETTKRRTKKFQSTKMHSLHTELARRVKVTKEMLDRMERAEAERMRDSLLLKEDPMMTINRHLEEVTQEIADLSIQEKIKEKVIEDHGEKEMHTIPREDLLSSVTDAIENLTITDQQRKLIEDETHRRFSGELAERRKERGLPEDPELTFEKIIFI